MKKEGKNIEEEVWILEQEQELLKKKRKEEAELRELEEKQKLKDLHYMHCPKCGNEMIEEVYSKGEQIVHIDKCPVCKSITLDDGELDLILDMNKSMLSKILKL